MTTPGKEKPKIKDQFIGKTLFNEYKIEKKIGGGCFGNVYLAKKKNNSFAVKTECFLKSQGFLEKEASILNLLKGLKVPCIEKYGYTEDHNILVMELMGLSLEDIIQKLPKKRMSLRCVCNLGYQMIEILESIHNKGIVHRDIKPDNFVIGKGYKSKYLYLLDFGLSTEYISPITSTHYPLVKRNKLIGNPRYASINALHGYTQSRRDDLEGLAYSIMYLLNGKLPWQDLKCKTKTERIKKIRDMKTEIIPEELAFGYPVELTEFISYIRLLDFSEMPVYSHLKNTFPALLKRDNYEIDYYYDWNKNVPVNDSILAEMNNPNAANSYEREKSNVSNSKIEEKNDNDKEEESDSGTENFNESRFDDETPTSRMVSRENNVVEDDQCDTDMGFSAGVGRNNGCCCLIY